MSEEKKSGGGLILNLTMENFVRVADVDIFFHSIKTSGRKGGKPEVAIRFVGPKTTKISRHNR